MLVSPPMQTFHRMQEARTMIEYAPNRPGEIENLRAGCLRCSTGCAKASAR